MPAAWSADTAPSDSYSAPVSTQSSNWITPISSKRWRSHLSDASRRPSFLQFGTIFEKRNWLNIWASGVSFVSSTASFTGTSIRSKTSWESSRSRMRTAASNANSWRSRSSTSERPS